MLCFGITPDDHEWLQAHAGDVEACAEYLDANAHRQRARAPLLRRRGAADEPPPAPPGRAVPDLGDAQRLARARAEHAGRDLRRDPGRDRDRRQRRSRGHRHRAHLHARPGGGDAGRVPRARARRPRRAGRRAGLDREVGARGDGAGACARSAATASADAGRPRRACSRWPSACSREGDRREGPAVGNLAPADARALLRAWLASVDLDDLSEADLVAYMQDDALHPRRPPPPRDAAPTSGCCARRSPRRSTRPRAARSAASAARCSPPASRRSRMRPRRRSSRASARSSRAARASFRASRSSPTGSARCTA